MNRRRSSAAAKKTPARDRRAPKKTARKTTIRKKAVKKSTARTQPSAQKPPSKNPRRKAAPKGAQNRRRPAPKPPRKVEPKPSFRERASGVKESVGVWVERHEGLGRRIGQVALFGLAAVATLWIGEQTRRYAHTADAFAIREVVIEGNEHLKAIDVRRAARLHIGSNIFEVSTEYARDHLMQHPWVKDATVIRKLPGRIRIELVERVPVALVALDQLYLVSEEGAVFKRLGVDDPVDLPVITGIASERFYDDFDYRTAVLLSSMALLQDYEGAGLAESEPVSEIHFAGPTGIELFVGRDGMHVRLGTGHHRQKLRRLRQVLTRLAKEKARPAYVYLDNIRSPERVTVRLR